MRKSRQENTAYYAFLNVNPHGKLSSDCVVRAIANATNQDWLTVYDELYKIGRKYGYMPNDDQCYSRYLTSIGWVKMKEPRNEFNKKYSVCDWVHHQLNSADGLDSYIIATVGSHHLTSIIDGRVNDIWNCSRETMHSYWVKKG